MHVVQEVHVVAVRLAHLLEQLRREALVPRCVPGLLVSDTGGGRLGRTLRACHAVRIRRSRNTRLNANCFVAELDLLADALESLAEILAGRVRVDESPFAA